MRANDRSLKNLKKGSELVAVNKKNGKKRKAGMSTFKKGDKEVKKGASRAVRAQALLDDYGLCPISMQPMRRPVLPSSGQAYDEISLQRYCRSGKRSCPVSGTDLKFTKSGKVTFTIDYALRKFITTHAGIANVFVPSTDKDSLMREVTDGQFRPEAAKAIVDDCYLGYVKIRELRAVLETLSSTDTCLDEVSPEHMTCRAIVAECLACRSQELCNLAVEYMAASTDLWKDDQVLREALAVGQDPDCRGEVLHVLESKVTRRSYSIAEMKTMLAFESENVPVQQFQCQTAETFVFHCIRSMSKGSMDKDWVPVVNQALRAFQQRRRHVFYGVDSTAPPLTSLLHRLAVREDLDGVSSGGNSIDQVWHAALLALKKVHGTLDEACLQRLFWRENCMVLQYLAQTHQELLSWHLKKHESSLSLCLQTIADHPFAPPGLGDEIYSSDEDEEQYLSEDDDEGFLDGRGYNAMGMHALRGHDPVLAMDGYYRNPLEG